MPSIVIPHVYTGFWINWTRGIVFGSTITLSQRHGGLLTAFLGIFVTAAGAACWRILSFLIHQYCAKKGEHDGLHYQRQVVLRNSSTAGAAAWQMTKVLWCWRKLAEKPWVRNCPLILLALCNMTLFAVAGVFSPEVTKPPQNVTLINSSECGYLLPTANTGAGFNAFDANTTFAAITYARACYNGAHDEMQCDRYVKPYLPFSAERNVTCPFQPDICYEGPSTAFKLDSGLIDTHDALGINANPSERLQIRKVTTCSVLNAKGRSKQVNVTANDGTNRPQMHYYYEGNGTEDDFVFRYNLDDAQGFTGYTLTPFYSFSGEKDEIFRVIPELSRDDADVTIMFLAPNTISYRSPVYDPWFMATTKSNLSDERNTLQQYEADYYVRPLACADQYQFCNPGKNICTPLTGSHPATANIDSLLLSRLQNETFVDLNYALQMMSTYFSVHSRGAAALRASDTVGADFIQVGLPADQWMTEVTEMFAVSMARLQQSVVTFATGPPYSHADMTFHPGFEDVCSGQMIRSARGHVSFSVFGVSVILIIGTMLILGALYLDIVVGILMRKRHYKDHKRVQGAQDENLHLLSHALASDGQGTWSGEMDTVPVTRKGERLRGLHTTDDPELHMLKMGMEHETPNDGTQSSQGPPEDEYSAKRGPIATVEEQCFY